MRLIVRDQRPIYRGPLKMLMRTERDYCVPSLDRGHMFWVYRVR